MIFMTLVVIDAVMLFIPFRNSILKKTQLLFSVGVCAWGIKKMSEYYLIGTEMWEKYFDRFDMAIPNQSSIQFS